MITQARPSKLTKRQDEELKLSIQRFRKWLQRTLKVDTSHKYEIITFVAADAGDWIMKADETMHEARFNPYVTKMCSLAEARILLAGYRLANLLNMNLK